MTSTISNAQVTARIGWICSTALGTTNLLGAVCDESEDSELCRFAGLQGLHLAQLRSESILGEDFGEEIGAQTIPQTQKMKELQIVEVFYHLLKFLRELGFYYLG